MTTFDHEPFEERETLEALERALPRVTPPPDMLDRILGEVGSEAVVVPLRRRVRARYVGPAAIAAVAAVVAVSVGIALSNGPEIDARAAISGNSAPTVAGEATLSGTALHVSLRGVPEAPSGHHYEVWVLPAGSSTMVSVGTFDTAGDIELDYRLPAGTTYAAVDVSVEEDEGPAEHSDTSLASGSFA